ncbi:hypothetical protein GG344DRAFT_83864 [Lentinula edodes]|nr:hypothetical protein GG344DRAFT_83864 [Lentinula edodes]KAJ3912089.1 hypothetical protein F5877DRAFT_85196 [Lentinula edodes]
MKNSFQSSNINPELASSDAFKHTTASHTHDGKCPLSDYYPCPTPFATPQDRLSDFQSLSRKHLRMSASEPDDDRSLNTIRAAPLAEPQAENYRRDPQSLEYDFLSTHTKQTYLNSTNPVNSPVAPEFLKHECLTDYLSSPSDVSPIQSSPSSSLFGSPITKTMDSNNNESGWVNTGDDINICNVQPQPMNNGVSETASNDQDTVPTSSDQVEEPVSGKSSR